MDFLIWVVLFIVLLFTLYCFIRYLDHTYSYWERLGIPSSGSNAFFGSLLEAFRKPMHEIDQKWYQKLGRIYGQYEGTRPVLTIADPDLLKNIFVKDFQYFVDRRNIQFGNPLIDSMIMILRGENWKRVRNLITPAFSTGKIKRMMSIILDSAETTCQNFSAAAKANEPVDMRRLFGAFTMDVIASTAFSTKIDSHNDPENKFVVTARKGLKTTISLSLVLFFLFPKIFKFLRPTFVSQEYLDFFKNVTLNIIEERKRTGQYRNDFLQLMMEAAGEVKHSTTSNETEEENEENITEFKESYSKKGLNHDELVAQCIVFFLGGYENTSSTLAYATYLLALNPDCQERLLKEIDETLLNNKGNFTYEAVQSMKYLDSVICETLRMFPSGVRLDRTAIDDYDLGYAGLKIPKGMAIIAPVYAIHHDPEFYPDPETFDPDRFTPEAKQERNPYTYLPFGAGPRNCIGMRFVLMEIKMLLAKFFSQFRVKRCPETKVPVEFHPAGAMLIPKSIILEVEERTDKIC